MGPQKRPAHAWGHVSKEPQGLEYLGFGKEGEAWALCEPFPWLYEKGHGWKRAGAGSPAPEPGADAPLPSVSQHY